MSLRAGQITCPKSDKGSVHNADVMFSTSGGKDTYTLVCPQHGILDTYIAGVGNPPDWVENYISDFNF